MVRVMVLLVLFALELYAFLSPLARMICVMPVTEILVVNHLAWWTSQGLPTDVQVKDSSHLQDVMQFSSFTLIRVN